MWAYSKWSCVRVQLHNWKNGYSKITGLIIYTPVSISISIYLYLYIHISCLYLYVDLYLSIYIYMNIYIYIHVCNMATFFDVVSCSVISDGALAVT